MMQEDVASGYISEVDDAADDDDDDPDCGQLQQQLDRRPALFSDEQKYMAAPCSGVLGQMVVLCSGILGHTVALCSGILGHTVALCSGVQEQMVAL